MGVLIKGMEMPKVCGRCVFCLRDDRICDGYCMFFHHKVNVMLKDKDCPLVEVPGRKEAEE